MSLRISAITIIFSIFASLLLNINLTQEVYSESKEFSQIKSEHFIINYQKGVDKSDISKIKNIAEKFYKIITQEFNLIRDKLWLWENRAKIYIAEDRESYLKHFPCSSWSLACVNYQEKIIYTYPGHPKLTPIFVHELTHIIFHEYIGEKNLPLWLDEGIAVYMENKYGDGAYRRGFSFLKKKIEKDSYIKLSDLNKITPKTLSDKSSDYVELFYLESFSIVNFIIEKYQRHMFSNFLYYLKRNYSVEEALARVFYHFPSFKELEERWKKFYLE